VALLHVIAACRFTETSDREHPSKMVSLSVSGYEIECQLLFRHVLSPFSSDHPAHHGPDNTQELSGGRFCRTRAISAMFDLTCEAETAPGTALSPDSHLPPAKSIRTSPNFTPGRNLAFYIPNGHPRLGCADRTRGKCMAGRESGICSRVFVAIVLMRWPKGALTRRLHRRRRSRPSPLASRSNATSLLGRFHRRTDAVFTTEIRPRVTATS